MGLQRRAAADGQREQPEGASALRSSQQPQRVTASARPPRDRWLSKLLAQPAPRPLSPFFAPSQQLRHSDPSSPIHLPGMESPRDCNKLSTFESHHFEKEQVSSVETSLPKVKPMSNEFVGDKLGNAHERRGLADIEQLLKQKIFTRDESNRLIELLRSRTIDLTYVDGHGPKFAAEAVEARSHKDLINLRKANDASRPDQVTQNDHDTLELTDKGEVGSSPVGIAKAYMQALASTSGIKSQSGRSITEKNRCNDDDYASNLSFSPAINTSTRWPGAVVLGDLGYCTPQTQRSRVVLQNFSRSPYSRALVSRYFSKSQVGDQNQNSSSAGWKQSYTPPFGANTTMKRKSSVLNDDLKSIGITRLVRQKNVTSTVAGTSDVQNSLPYFSETLETLESSESSFPRNVEHGSSIGNLMMPQLSGKDENRPVFVAGSSSVHPQSSEIARKILDDISRTVPSPKEKALELMTAITRLKVPSISTNLIMDSKENLPLVSSAANQFADCFIGKVDSAQDIVHTHKVPDGSAKDLASSCHLGTSSTVHLTPKPWPCFSDHDSVLKSITDGVLSKEPKLSGESSKPSDDGKLKIFDNTSSFTFPVPVDTVASSEPPPTPTLFPLAAEKKNYLRTEGIPAFTFGSCGTGNGLVFSFAGISVNADIIDPTLKFHFGSDKKRLSFTPFANDTVCCL